MVSEFIIYFCLTFALNFGMQSPRVLSVTSIVGSYWDAMPQVIVRQASAVRLSRGEAHWDWCSVILSGREYTAGLFSHSFFHLSVLQVHANFKWSPNFIITNICLILQVTSKNVIERNLWIKLFLTLKSWNLETRKEINRKLNSLICFTSTPKHSSHS